MRLVHILVILIPFFCYPLMAQQVQISGGQDTINVCAGKSVTLQASGAESYIWAPSSILNVVSGPEVIATPETSGYVYVQGDNQGIISIDSVYLMVVDISLQINANNIPTPFCEGLPVQLDCTPSTLGGNLSWFVGSLKVGEGFLVTLPGPRGGSIRAEYNIDGCTFLDSIQLNVIEFGTPKPSFSDTTVCQGQHLVLATSTGSINTVYQWSPNIDISNINIPNAVASPKDTTTYKLVYQSENGICKDSFELTIKVIPIELELNITDPVLLCLGDSIAITASINGAENGLTWGPNDGALSALNGRTVVAKPDYTNFYFARYELNGCVLIDTFLIRVDSIPSMPITTIVSQPDYCPGEIVVFASPLYDALLYPDITHEWTPQDGTLLSDPSFYNLTIETSPGERTYIRTTRNGGCLHQDSVTIIVKDPQIMVSPMDTIVCPGTNVQLRILNEVEKIEWTPPTGLSCSDCPNPIATASGNRVYRVQGEVEGCPAETQVRVRSHPLPLITLGKDPDKFRYVVGEDIEVFVISVPSLPATTVFSWTYNGQVLNDNDSIVSINLSKEVNEISVQFTTVDGCIVVTSLTIQAEPPVYRIPNAFTPNSDQINDLFQVYVEGNVQVVNMEIYNRWGQVMYKGNDNSGWDGRFNGAACPPEVYAYKVTVRLGNGELIQEKGDLTLLR
jgi:gliding motility-associated-like protein